MKTFLTLFGAAALTASAADATSFSSLTISTGCTLPESCTKYAAATTAFTLANYNDCIKESKEGCTLTAKFTPVTPLTSFNTACKVPDTAAANTAYTVGFDLSALVDELKFEGKTLETTGDAVVNFSAAPSTPTASVADFSGTLCTVAGTKVDLTKPATGNAYTIKAQELFGTKKTGLSIAQTASATVPPTPTLAMTGVEFSVKAVAPSTESASAVFGMAGATMVAAYVASQM